MKYYPKNGFQNYNFFLVNFSPIFARPNHLRLPCFGMLTPYFCSLLLFYMFWPAYVFSFAAIEASNSKTWETRPLMPLVRTQLPRARLRVLMEEVHWPKNLERQLIGIVRFDWSPIRGFEIFLRPSLIIISIFYCSSAFLSIAQPLTTYILWLFIKWFSQGDHQGR